MSLGLVLLVIGIAVLAASVLAIAATFEMNLSGHDESVVAARNLADSVIANTFAAIEVNPFFGAAAHDPAPPPNGLVAPAALNRGKDVAAVSFDRTRSSYQGLSLPYSTNNFTDFITANATLTGALGRAVPSGAIEVYATARHNGVVLTTTALLYYPNFPYAVMCAQDVTIDHSLIGAVSSNQAVRKADGTLNVNPNNILPGDCITNSTSNTAMTLQNHTEVTGDAEAIGAFVTPDGIAPAGTVVIDGQLDHPGEPVPLPAMSYANYASLYTAGALQLPASAWSSPVSGLAYRAGDLDVPAGQTLALNNALLMVNGNLTVEGNLQGVGAIFVANSARLAGQINLASTDQIALEADGDISVYGSGRNAAAFQGMMLANGHFDAHDISLLGAYIALGAPIAPNVSTPLSTNTTMWLDDVNVLHNNFEDVRINLSSPYSFFQYGTDWTCGWADTPDGPRPYYLPGSDSGDGTFMYPSIQPPPGLTYGIGRNSTLLAVPSDGGAPVSQTAPYTNWQGPNTGDHAGSMHVSNCAFQLTGVSNNMAYVSLIDSTNYLQIAPFTLRLDSLANLQADAANVAAQIDAQLDTLNQQGNFNKGNGGLAASMDDGVLQQFLINVLSAYVQSKQYANGQTYTFSFNPNQYISLADRARLLLWKQL